VDFGWAKLRGANLYEANLTNANLNEANLSGAILYGAKLSGTNLNGANLSEATCGATIFADTDLSFCRGLETVYHLGPSSIGLDTIFKSKGKIPEIFLRGAGVPDIFIQYMGSLTGKAFAFYSCFISYSTKDKAFAQRLYADLQNKGVRCWLFPEDAKWGETLWGEIDSSIKLHDKVVLVCSEDSLQRPAVLRELERSLQKEDRDRKNVLFPIRLDDYIFDGWEHERKADVVKKVVGDFRKWKDHDAYQKSFDRLLRNLKGKAVASF
jgi:hypothetical protein